MGAGIVVSDVQAMFRRRYIEERPFFVKGERTLYDMFKFGGPIEGESTNMPVALTMSHGFTYNGSGGSIVNMNSPISLSLGNASPTATELLMREQISFAALARGGVNGAITEQSFGRTMDIVVEAMEESFYKRCELALLYGAGDGTAANNTIGLARLSASSGSSTSRVLTVTAQTWAQGIWEYFEEAELDAINTTTGAVINTTAAIVFKGIASASSRTLNVNGNATDLTALDAAIANAMLVPRGSHTRTFAGVLRILSNTGSLFGIDAASYSVWRATTATLSTVSASFADVLTQVQPVIAKGLKTESMLLVSNSTWANIMNDLAALRRFVDGNGAKLEQGSEGLYFYTQAGGMLIRAHNYLWDGRMALIVPEDWRRTGVYDVTWSVPGSPEEKYMSPVPGVNAFELKLSSNFGLFCKRPSRQALFTIPLT